MMTKTTLFRLLFITCALSVLVLALLPHSPSVLTTGWDKSNHTLAFFVLAILGTFAYPTAVVALPIGLFGFGGAIELLQWLTTTRSAELSDLVADTLGLAVAYLTLAFARRCIALIQLRRGRMSSVVASRGSSFRRARR
jgi:VanZ family protein